MECLPARLVADAVIPPVGVEAEASGVRHDDEHVALAREVCDAAVLGPVDIAAEAAMQEIKNWPRASGMRRKTMREEDAGGRGVAERRRVDRDVHSAWVEHALGDHGGAVVCLNH